MSQPAAVITAPTDSRLAAVVDSLIGVGPITPHQLVRCDPLSFDLLARSIAEAGIVLSGDTTLCFDATPDIPNG